MVVLDFVAIVFAIGVFGIFELIWLALLGLEPFEPIEEIECRIEEFETIGDVFAIIGNALLLVIYSPSWLLIIAVNLISIPFQLIGMACEKIAEIKIINRR